jgi:hypothetical protein
VSPENTLVVAWLHRLGASPPDGRDQAYRLPIDRVFSPEAGQVRCGCMGGCWSTCSDPYGSVPGPPMQRLPQGSGLAMSWESSPPAEDVPSPPRSSWSWCGPMLRPR